MNIINNNLDTKSKYPQMMNKNSVTIDTSNFGQFDE